MASLVDPAFSEKVRGYKRLSRDQLRTLTPLAKAGDTEARNRIVESVMPSILNMSRRMIEYPAASREDYIQCGVIEAMLAVDKYDPEKASFHTYVLPSVHGAMIDLSGDSVSTVKIGKYYYVQMDAYRKHAEKLAIRLQREPTFTEVADGLGLSPNARVRFKDAMRAVLGVGVICSGHDDDDGEGEYATEIYGDVPDREPHEPRYSKEDMRKLEVALAGIKERDRDIIERTLATDNMAEENKSLARRHGLTLPGVSYVRLAAVQKLALLLDV